MDRRRLAQVGLAVVLVLGVVVVGVRWWTRPRLVEAGDAVVVVEGHDFSLSEAYAGYGLVGRLRLVEDRCVGFQRPGRAGIVALFPAGASASGAGDRLAVSSGGSTIRVGERVEVGAVDVDVETRRSIQGIVPVECAAADVVLIFPGG